jgi:uncharacterized membrane protein
MTSSDLSSDTFVTTALAGPARGPLLVVATVVAGLQAGTYFTWATGVMPGLARVDDRTFVHAMQQMNVAIVNPLFLATFIGAPVLAGAAVALGGSHSRGWAIAATALTIGTVAITAAGNVPLNDALQAAGGIDRITDLAAVRADFESRWVALNIARCLTSAGALACLAVAATKVPG